MNTSFLSTSKDRQVAEFFVREADKVSVLCIYEIHNKNKRRTALDISRISNFNSEREVLILPLSAFRVKSVTCLSNNPKSIEITLVEDNTETLEILDTS